MRKKLRVHFKKPEPIPNAQLNKHPYLFIVYIETESKHEKAVMLLGSVIILGGGLQIK